MGGRLSVTHKCTLSCCYPQLAYTLTRPTPPALMHPSVRTFTVYLCVYVCTYL